MTYLMIRVLFGTLGVAVFLIILAWQNDYDLHGRLTCANCAATTALLAGAIVVFVGIIYMLLIGGGK
jgi:hypothetical protein